MQARCFNCEKQIMNLLKPMEELVDIEFSVFCCLNCADEFPGKGTEEFKKRIKELKEKYGGKNGNNINRLQK